MIRLTERLQKIADGIHIGERVADIGSDHGYLPIYLWEKRISNHIIVTDIKKSPLNIAKKNIRGYISKEVMDFRLGSGLEILENAEVDTAVIAGMGGLLIMDILSKDISKSLSFKKIILQPRNAQDKLRKWLVQNGFKIAEENLAKEGKFICEIITVIPGKDKELEDIYYEIGIKLLENKDPLLEKFILKKIEIEKNILKDTKNKSSKNAVKQYEHSKNRVHQLEEVLNHVRFL